MNRLRLHTLALLTGVLLLTGGLLSPAQAHVPYAGSPYCGLWWGPCPRPIGRRPRAMSW
jgi:hypothetical protein